MIFDQESGEDLSVTGGQCIITIGQFGIIGFLAEFGLLILPPCRYSESPQLPSLFTR
jgi:hypothetical protein